MALLPSNIYFSMVLLTLISGVLSFTASLFGTLGALKYNLTSMRWNILLVLLSLAIETIGIALGIYYNNQLELSSLYYEQANELYNINTRDLTRNHDILQKDLIESFNKFGIDESITESINQVSKIKSIKFINSDSKLEFQP